MMHNSELWTVLAPGGAPYRRYPCAPPLLNLAQFKVLLIFLDLDLIMPSVIMQRTCIPP
jgi:hypothetical protein